MQSKTFHCSSRKSNNQAGLMMLLWLGPPKSEARIKRDHKRRKFPQLLKKRFGLVVITEDS